MVVPIKMIGRDVEQNGNISAKIVHIVQLKTAQLYNIIFMRVLSYLQSQTSSYVSCQSYIISRRLKDMIYQRGGGSFAIAPGDAHHFCVGVSAGKLNLADDVNTFLDGFLHHWRFFRDTRTLDNLVGIKYLFFRMLPLFPFNLAFIEHRLVLVFDGRHIRHKHLKALLLGQCGGTYSAFGCS